jgi:hypothetical protein
MLKAKEESGAHKEGLLASKFEHKAKQDREAKQSGAHKEGVEGLRTRADSVKNRKKRNRREKFAPFERPSRSLAAATIQISA